MKTHTAEEFADGLGIKQDLPRQQVQQIRQQYKQPPQVVDGFLMANFRHIDSLGRLKRSVLEPSARNLYRSHVTTKQITFRPWVNVGMNNSLYHQLQQPAPDNPNIQHPGEYIMPQYTPQYQQHYRPYQYSQPNYAGQYQQPQRIDMNNATVTPQFNNQRSVHPNVQPRMNPVMNYNNEQAPVQHRSTMARQNQNQVNNSELQMQEAQREIRDAQRKINAIHQQKRRAIIQRNNQMQR